MSVRATVICYYNMWALKPSPPPNQTFCLSEGANHKKAGLKHLFKPHFKCHTLLTTICNQWVVRFSFTPYLSSEHPHPYGPPSSWELLAKRRGDKSLESDIRSTAQPQYYEHNRSFRLGIMRNYYVIRNKLKENGSMLLKPKPENHLLNIVLGLGAPSGPLENGYSTSKSVMCWWHEDVAKSFYESWRWIDMFWCIPSGWMLD